MRIEAIHLGRLDDGHGPGQRLGAGVGTGEQPVASSDSDRPQGPLRCVVVDGDAAIFEEQAERGPARQCVAECVGKIALGRDTRKLLLCPGTERRHFGFAVRLACSKARVGALAGNAALDVIERADPVQRLACDGRPGADPEIMKVPAQIALQAVSLNRTEPSAAAA